MRYFKCHNIRYEALNRLSNNRFHWANDRNATDRAGAQGVRRQRPGPGVLIVRARWPRGRSARLVINRQLLENMTAGTWPTSPVNHGQRLKPSQKS